MNAQNQPRTERKIWKNWKNGVAVLTGAAFGISLIPLLLMSRYVHASGDDYGYGAMAHAAWLDTHSLMEVFKASAQTIKQYYYSWQGTWSSIFLFTLQPEVFSPNAYWIVPPLMIGLTIAGVSLLGYYLMVTKIGFSKRVFWTVDCLLLLSMMQFVPRTKSALFWYNGTAHYVVPYFFAMTAIYSFFKFIDTYKWRYWLIALFSMFFLGGASYLAALLAPIVLVYLLLLYGWKRKKTLWLLIPLLVEGIGLIISMKAPGNVVRGGENMAFSVGKVISVIAGCFVRGVTTCIEYCQDKPLVFVLLFFVTVVVWGALISEKIEYNFSYPVIFVGLMFCTWCAMFAPELYSGDEVSGGVPNTVYYVFLLTVYASVIHVLGWLHRVLGQKNALKAKVPFYLDEIRWMKMVVLPVAALCAVLVVVFRGDVKGTTMFQCVEYVRSGQADDFNEQIASQQKILLDDSIREAYLCPINDQQGPIMHMPVTTNPDAFTNWATRIFYRKDLVVMEDEGER